MGDLKMTLDNPNFNVFIEDHELSTLISEPTYFRNINQTCIENILTSKKTRFMNTLAFKTGVSDHHKLIGTMLRSTFAKGKPKKIFYRCYKNFDNEKFQEELKKHFSSVLDFESFHLAFKTTINRFPPLKQNVVRNNNQPFIKKALRQVIMKSSKLKNKFNQERNAKNWSNYRQQRMFSYSFTTVSFILVSFIHMSFSEFIKRPNRSTNLFNITKSTQNNASE